MVALMTLVYLAAFKFTASGIAAGRTNEPIGPAQLIQSLLTLGFIAILFEKLVQSEAFLKLNHIFRHDGKPPVFSGFHYANLTGSIAEPRR